MPGRHDSLSLRQDGAAGRLPGSRSSLEGKGLLNPARFVLMMFSVLVVLFLVLPDAVAAEKDPGWILFIYYGTHHANEGYRLSLDHRGNLTFVKETSGCVNMELVRHELQLDNDKKMRIFQLVSALIDNYRLTDGNIRPQKDSFFFNVTLHNKGLEFSCDYFFSQIASAPEEIREIVRCMEDLEKTPAVR